MRLNLLLLISATFIVVFNHNPNGVATREFKFKDVPSPIANDAAATAKLTLIDGELDGNSADLSALIDGRLPTDEDDPGANVFFNAGSSGGRFRIDLGNPIDIAQINSYSWHPNSRGPQLYKLYAAAGTEPQLDLNPKRGVDPATRGWKFITTVNTLPQQGEDGGQYGVSVRNTSGRLDASGSLGKYRYLLFDCYVTELYDNRGNTFYSEIDVIATQRP
ncbi:MAG TPA: hypothetical protein VJ749_10450 [Pyrinomonadaceae bacterium]|jgi:hypothetical protein|nr:hypothetical protein [Pyrinomonadaceae bacterium]